MGTAYSFDGIDDYVDCGDITELNDAYAFTILGWIKQNNHNNNERVFDKIHDGNHDISVAPYNNRIYFKTGHKKFYGLFRKLETHVIVFIK